MHNPMPGRWLIAGATALLTVACGAPDLGDSVPAQAAPALGADAKRAACILSSPYLQVGSEIDAPGSRIEVDTPPVGRAPGACGGNTQFRFGSGLHDITGPVANTSGMGWEYPLQVFSGLHTRLHARAFALASPCNGRRVMFVSADIGLIWPALRSGVLGQLAADPALAAHYGGDNVMISATHTHQGPAGYSHDDGGNLFHLGYDDLNYRIIVDGIVEAIRLAHANIEAHAQPAPIRLTVAELLNTNINRSPPAFALNAAAERGEFLDARGEEIDTDKRFVQLSLVRRNGSAVGVINWFGVHPTILGPNLDLVGSDHKGYASLGFERIMRTRYDAAPGADTFVAAFAQTNEGDASPNLYIMERPFPDPTRGGGRDEYETNAIIGTKQLAKALEPLGLLFIEEPLLSENAEGLKQIAELTSIPIALGERLYSRWDFKPFFESGAVDIIQPDLSHAGGLLECRKIAAMAETYDIAVAPHCPLGPLALAACLQLAACTPNVAIQEMSLGIHYNVGADLLSYCSDQAALTPVDGYLAIPDGPGLGISIDEDAVRESHDDRHRWRNPVWRLSDGSFAEW